MSEFMGFKLNPAQKKILKHIQDNPSQKQLVWRGGVPSYEMVQLARYLKGDFQPKLKIDKIIFDEATDSPKPVQSNMRTTDPAEASSEPEGKPNE